MNTFINVLFLGSVVFIIVFLIEAIKVFFVE